MWFILKIDRLTRHHVLSTNTIFRLAENLYCGWGHAGSTKKKKKIENLKIKKTWENMVQICRRGKAELYPSPYIYKSWTERSEGGRLQKQAICTQHARTRTHTCTHAAATWFFFSFLLYVCMKKKREGGVGWENQKSKKKLWLFFFKLFLPRVFGLIFFRLSVGSCVVHRASCFFFFFSFRLGFLGSEESMSHVGKYSFPESPLGKDRCGPDPKADMIILSFEIVSMYAVTFIIPSLPFCDMGKSCRLLIFTFFSLSFSLSRAHEGERGSGRGVAIKRFWRWRIHIHK